MRMRGKKPIFGYRDTWNLNDVLIPIIVEGIRKFRAVEHEYKGVPQTIMNDVYGSAFSHTNEQVEYAAEVWNKKLDFIVEALTAPEPDYTKGFTPGPNHGERTEEGYVTWERFPTDPDAWEQYKRECEVHARNKRLALEYVGKYMLDLWW